MHKIGTYTAKYTKIEFGYMGQIVEWPEVVTEGISKEACRGLLKKALLEMIKAYQEQNKESPPGSSHIEPSP